jgi:diaminohydroxyphosphoribosylaminopyrimidine deaminase/5-amino-6-(5-phosphoribosylamino)uracil reductase
VLAPRKRGLLDLKFVLGELGRREVISVLLESGPTLNAAALAARVVDKLILFYAPKLAGRATVPFVRGSVAIPRFHSHRLREQEFGPDFAVEAWLRDPYRG